MFLPAGQLPTVATFVPCSTSIEQSAARTSRLHLTNRALDELDSHALGPS